MVSLSPSLVLLGHTQRVGLYVLLTLGSFLPLCMPSWYRSAQATVLGTDCLSYLTPSPEQVMDQQLNAVNRNLRGSWGKRGEQVATSAWTQQVGQASWDKAKALQRSSVLSKSAGGDGLSRDNCSSDLAWKLCCFFSQFGEIPNRICPFCLHKTELPFPKGLQAVFMESNSQPREKTLLRRAPNLSCHFLLIRPLRVFVEKRSRKGLKEEKWCKKIEDEGGREKDRNCKPGPGDFRQQCTEKGTACSNTKNGPCSTKWVPSVDLRVPPVWVVLQSSGLASS